MARIRSIHPDACDSEKLGALTADSERLFWRLQTHCDDEGRCEDNPRLIAARCVPLVDGWDAAKVDQSLDELHSAGLIVRYEVDGNGYIEVEQWKRFQHPQRPTKSKLPPAEMATPRVVREGSLSGLGLLISGGEGRGDGDGVLPFTQVKEGYQQAGDNPRPWDPSKADPSCLLCNGTGWVDVPEPAEAVDRCDCAKRRPA